MTWFVKCVLYTYTFALRILHRTQIHYFLQVPNRVAEKDQGKRQGTLSYTRRNCSVHQMETRGKSLQGV